MIRPFGDGRDRYFTERLGMFIHWGLYAIPAWHEQILFGVGMNIADHPLHRSRRAGLPHRAPTSGMTPSRRKG